MKRKVVVTGMGAVCCLGNNVDAVWRALCAGKYGIAPITGFDATDYRFRESGEVRGLDLRECQDALDWGTRFVLAAAREALSQSGLCHSDDNATQGGARPRAERLNDSISRRAAVVLATNFGGIASGQKFLDGMIESRNTGAKPPPDPSLFNGLNYQSAVDVVSETFGFGGPRSTLSLSCASGNAAIGYAVDLIRYGRADIALAGGYDVLTEYAWSGLSTLRTMTTDRIRPFDLNRDGTIFSEGAAVLVLESEEHAEERSGNGETTILCEVAGHGMNNNAYHLAHPDKGATGTVGVMQMALDDANMKPEEIDHISAHGTGTKQNDNSETNAIKTVFGEHAYKIPVNSIKSMTGHVMGASSAIEAVAAIMTISGGIVPPTINYETPDPECDLNYVPNTSIEANVAAVLSNSAGIGGANSAVIFRRSAP